MALQLSLLLCACCAAFANAHSVITYPGWRGGYLRPEGMLSLSLTNVAGDNLKTTGTPPAENPDTIGVDYVNGTYEFPYGQEWIYPCETLCSAIDETES